MRHATALFCAASVLLGLQGPAMAKGMTLGQLKALVKDLGYDASSDGDATVTIPEQGKWGKNIFLTLHDEGDNLDISSNFGELPDSATKVIPLTDILRANGDSPFFFSVAPVDGKATLFLEGYLPTATLNKQALRKAIDNWLVRIDATEGTWNQDHWAAAAAPPAPATPPAVAAAPPSPAAQRIFCDPAVEKGPLKIESASFRTGPAGGEAGKIVRPNVPFGPEEPMYVVLEITGFRCKGVEAGRYQALFTIDQAIKRSTDPDYEPFLSLSKSLEFDSSKTYDRAFIDLTLTPHWKASGAFTFRYSVHDNVAGTDATIATPLTIDAPK